MSDFFLGKSALIEKWSAHPYVREYMRVQRERGSFRLHTPAEVIGEMGAVVLGLALGGYTFSSASRIYALQRGGADLGLHFAQRLDKAIPFLWLDDIFGSAIKAEIPRHHVSTDLFPFPACWFTEESAHGDPEHPGRWIDGALVLQDGGLVQILQVGSERSSDAPSATDSLWAEAVQIQLGKVYPDDYGVQAAGLRQFLGLASFLNSPYIGASPQRASRAERRSLIKAEIPEPEVRFVALRPSELRRSPSEGHSEPPDWKHRWIVRGHHRAQWYPSTQSHKLIWVAPYIKGPEGLPFTAPGYSVVR